MRNLESYYNSFQMSLVGDTEQIAISYLTKLEIPYRVVLRNGVVQFTTTSPYNNRRANFVVTNSLIA